MVKQGLSMYLTHKLQIMMTMESDAVIVANYTKSRLLRNIIFYSNQRYCVYM